MTEDNNMTRPTIYLDLDETLFHTICRRVKGTSGRTWINFDDNFLGSTWYGSQERPCAKELIAFCRSLAPTKILTTSVQDYARVFNEVFEFGFTNEEIITRHDYVNEEITSAGLANSRYSYTVINHRNEPNAILVDNLYPEENENKIKFLGIDKSRYIHIRDYVGGKDPAKFLNEFDIIKDRIRLLTKQLTEG